MRPLPPPSPADLRQDLAFLDRCSALAYPVAEASPPFAEASSTALPLPAVVGPRWAGWMADLGVPVTAAHQAHLQAVFWPELRWPDRPTNPLQRKAERQGLKTLVRQGPLAKRPLRGEYSRPEGWQEPPKPPALSQNGGVALIGVGLASFMLRITLGTPWTVWLSTGAAGGFALVMGTIVRWRHTRRAVRQHNARLLPGAREAAAHRASITPTRNERARWAQHPALAAHAAACADSRAGWMEGDRVRLNAAWERLRHGRAPTPAVPERRFIHITIEICHAGRASG